MKIRRKQILTGTGDRGERILSLYLLRIVKGDLEWHEHGAGNSRPLFSLCKSKKRGRSQAKIFPQKFSSSVPVTTSLNAETKSWEEN